MADVCVQISFCKSEPSKSSIKTNLREGAIEDILLEFVRANQSAGPDHSIPNEREIYDIKIYLDLSDDRFSVESDTGNKGLTLGIVMAIIPLLDEISIGSLPD